MRADEASALHFLVILESAMKSRAAFLHSPFWLFGAGRSRFISMG
jgi:hypothetical protein